MTMELNNMPVLTLVFVTSTNTTGVLAKSKNIANSAEYLNTFLFLIGKYASAYLLPIYYIPKLKSPPKATGDLFQNLAIYRCVIKQDVSLTKRCRMNMVVSNKPRYSC